jgi:hypothetical protein
MCVCGGGVLCVRMSVRVCMCVCKCAYVCDSHGVAINCADFRLVL